MNLSMSIYAKAAIAAVLIGAGIALFASAVQDAKTPCTDCGDAEEVAAEVAAASAELTEPEADE